ncbi:FG-GAP repeat domain-containing protein [Stenotrophomonas maltophilia]|uniref:FG-GAP repeat domain-containing protein n=1 Tax=Stenotrophomonas maltophilia TaxID=40324 RepID=UPI0039C3D35E
MSMKRMLAAGVILTLMGGQAWAVGPRFSNHPSTTVLSVSKSRPAPGERINLVATVSAPALGAFFGVPIGGDDIGGTVDFKANGVSIGSARIGRANAPVVGRVSDLDKGCFAATRDITRCTLVFYYANQVRLSVPYQIPVNAGNVRLSATFSGDGNFAQGSTSADIVAPSPPVVYALQRSVNPARLDALSPEGGYLSYKFQTPTSLSQLGDTSQFQIQMADFDADGIDDLFFINRSNTGSGRTEVHVLKGPEYQTYLVHAATALHETGNGADWKFLVGDYDRDGLLDIYAVKKSGSAGKVELHVLDGKTGYSTFLAQHETALDAAGTSKSVDFALGDYDRDGKPDLYFINKTGASGKTEVHVLSASSAFRTFSAHIVTALGLTGAGNEWAFGVAEYNNDGAPDVFAFRQNSAKAEVHVLDGASSFQSSLQQVSTPVDAGPGSGVELMVGN